MTKHAYLRTHERTAEHLLINLAAATDELRRQDSSSQGRQGVTLVRQAVVGHGALVDTSFRVGAARRHIQVQSIHPGWAPSGLHAIARIRSRDHEFPRFVYELDGE